MPRGTDISWRRHDPALLASSYGPVYCVLRDNGQMLYIADGVNARDYAYDVSRLKPIRVGVTPRIADPSERKGPPECSRAHELGFEVRDELLVSSERRGIGLGRPQHVNGDRQSARANARAVREACSR